MRCGRMQVYEMKKRFFFKNKNIWYRLILELVLAVAAALVIELGFNYQALTGGYGPMDLSQKAVVKDGMLVCSKRFDEPIYIDKLIVQGEFHKRTGYAVRVSEINDFGVEESVKITDKAYPGFEYAFTNIGKKVTSIKVVFKNAKAVTLEGLSYSNEVDFHKLRAAFFALVCFLALLIIFEHRLVVKKIEIIYLVGALGFGSIMIAAAGPRAVTWDEEVHYRLTYLMNFNQEVNWNQAAALNTTRNAPEMNTAEELVLLKQYVNKLSLEEEEKQQSVGLFHKEYITHLPMILLYHIGEALNLPYTVQFAMGRLGNLLFCVVLNFISIYLAKRKRLLIAAVALMPTVLFQGSMITYDGIIFSCLTLGVVFAMNEMENGQGNSKYNWKKLLLSAVLFLVGCIAKPVYFPVFLLLVPMLWRMGKQFLTTKRRKRLLLTGFLTAGILCVAVLGFYLSPFLSNFINGNAAYGGDVRGGNTGFIGQTISILKHPLAFVKMLVHELFTMDNFRNFGNASKNRFMAGNLMFLNLYVLGILKDAWSLVLLPLLALVFLAEPEGEAKMPGNIRKIRWTNLAVTVCCVLLIWVAMYLAFTPIGNNGIEGVQARYFLPLFLPTAYVVWNNRIQVRISRLRYGQLAMGAVLLLTSVCFYQTLIAGRVM